MVFCAYFVKSFKLQVVVKTNCFAVFRFVGTLPGAFVRFSHALICIA